MGERQRENVCGAWAETTIKQAYTTTTIHRATFKLIYTHTRT